MCLFDLLTIMDATIPGIIKFSNGIKVDISNQSIKEEYKYYYVLHISKENDYLIYNVDISFEMKL